MKIINTLKIKIEKIVSTYLIIQISFLKEFQVVSRGWPEKSITLAATTSPLKVALVCVNFNYSHILNT